MTEEPEPDVEWCDTGSALEQCRERLDELDTRLVEAIGERLQLCADIARIKRRSQIPMMQPHRLAHVHATSVEKGRKWGLDEGFVHRLIDVILQESCRLEDIIIANKRTPEDSLQFEPEHAVTGENGVAAYPMRLTRSGGTILP